MRLTPAPASHFHAALAHRDPPPTAPAVTSDIETVEASKVIDAARLQSYYSAALQEIEENLSSLQRVRADVNATSKIDPAVKAQVCTRPRDPSGPAPPSPPRPPPPSPPPPPLPRCSGTSTK